jgi:hypothetical protein
MPLLRQKQREAGTIADRHARVRVAGRSGRLLP